MNKSSDLHRFIHLYRSFGINCKINHVLHGNGEKSLRVVLRGNDYEDVNKTESRKFDGYEGFFSNVNFTLDGAFLNQEFYQ